MEKNNSSIAYILTSALSRKSIFSPLVVRPRFFLFLVRSFPLSRPSKQDKAFSWASLCPCSLPPRWRHRAEKRRQIDPFWGHLTSDRGRWGWKQLTSVKSNKDINYKDSILDYVELKTIVNFVFSILTAWMCLLVYNRKKSDHFMWCCISFKKIITHSQA